MSQLNTEASIKFFEQDFLLKNNTNILQSLQVRTTEDYIDSVYESLLELQISDPFVEDLIPLIGYPVWSQAVVHDYLDPDSMVVTLPFADINDTLTQGIITSILDNGEWRSYFMERDSLCCFSSSLITEEGYENVPVYLIGLLHFDFSIFGRIDTFISNGYTNVSNGFTGSEPQIKFRGDPCGTVITQITYQVPCIEMAITGSEGKIIPRGDCHETEVLMEYNDCPGGGGGGGGGGGTVGASTGSVSGGGGSSTGTACRFSVTGIPQICIYTPNYYDFSINFIAKYNVLINYLSDPIQAEWLQDYYLNDNPDGTDLINDLAYFLEHYSNNKILNASIIEYYISYLQNENIPHTTSLPNIAGYLNPYVIGLQSQQEA